jgi:ubiquinone/menaquinone biosynthesis C-methylase UbiE
LLLDAGCGKGDSIWSLPSKVELVGVDVLRANVLYSKRRWRKRSYLVADLNMLPFRESTFGGTLSSDVLEHVDNNTAVLKEFARITVKGGFFIGCSSNILNPVMYLYVKLPRLMMPLVMKLAGAGHYDRHSRFSPRSLAKTLKATGYQMNYLYLLGYPSLRQRSYLGLLAYGYFLTSLQIRNLYCLKEVLIWQAIRI